MLELDITKKAHQQLKKLDLTSRKKIINKVNGLVRDPFPPGVKKINAMHKGYRIRIGDYRVIYRILSQLQIIRVYRIDHRSKVYQNL
ncbi:type II toxin-antitoxin system RelE/ParE family toxin [Patescibacteria group bacterium]|nr:type II toxin-antitoxin system RelE/ParE family toxin [Patescibacteria group bacterium]